MYIKGTVVFIFLNFRFFKEINYFNGAMPGENLPITKWVTGRNSKWTSGCYKITSNETKTDLDH